MTKKELRERLYDYWQHSKGGLVGVDIWQKCPYTAVCVRIGGAFTYGFAKVQYPDTWDSQYGADLAVKKALADIVKHLPDDILADIEVLLEE